VMFRFSAAVQERSNCQLYVAIIKAESLLLLLVLPSPCDIEDISAISPKEHTTLRRKKGRLANGLSSSGRAAMGFHKARWFAYMSWHVLRGRVTDVRMLAFLPSHVLLPCQHCACGGVLAKRARHDRVAVHPRAMRPTISYHASYGGSVPLGHSWPKSRQCKSG